MNIGSCENRGIFFLSAESSVDGIGTAVESERKKMNRTRKYHGNSCEKIHNICKFRVLFAAEYIQLHELCKSISM